MHSAARICLFLLFISNNLFASNIGDFEWSDSEHRQVHGDFNGDGHPDFLLFSKFANYPSWFANGNAPEELLVPSSVFISKDYPLTVSGKFLQSKKDEVLFLTPSLEGEVFEITDGRTVVSKETNIRVKKNNVNLKDITTVLAGDFDADGLSDFAAYSDADRTFFIFENASKSVLKFKYRDEVRLEGAGKFVPLISDFNGDGQDDIALIAATAESDSYVAFSGKNGRFKKSDFVVLTDTLPSEWNENDHTLLLWKEANAEFNQILKVSNTENTEQDEPQDTQKLSIQRNSVSNDDQVCRHELFTPATGEITLTCGPWTNDEENSPQSSISSASRIAVDCDGYDPLSIQNTDNTYSISAATCEPNLEPPATPTFTPVVRDGYLQGRYINYTVEMGAYNNVTYELQKKPSGGTWSKIKTTTSMFVTQRDTVVGDYYYRYRLCNVWGCSGYSKAYKVHIYGIPSAPTNLAVATTSTYPNQKVSMTWTPGAGIVSLGFHRFFVTNPHGTDTQLSEVPAGTNSHTAKVGSVPGLYKYNLRACNPVQGCSSTVIKSITVNNRPPTTAQDTIYLDEGHTGTINVLMNDSEPDGHGMKVVAYTQPSKGSVTCTTAICTVSASNDLTTNYVGSFNYTVEDSYGAQATGKVVVRVNNLPEGVAPAPSISPSGRKYDTSQTITITSTTPNASIYYTTNGTSPTKSSSAYSSPFSITNDATVKARVYALDYTESAISQQKYVRNYAPTPARDYYTVLEDSGATTFDVTANDTDPNGDSLTVTNLAGPQNGSISKSGNLISYTPNKDFCGDDYFFYRVEDATLYDSTRVNVTVTCKNDAPFFPSGLRDVTIDENSSSTQTFTISDVDTSISTLVITKNSSNLALLPTANIVLSGTGSTRTVKVTPRAGTYGTSTVSITISDGQLSTTKTYKLTVNKLPDPPVVNAGSNIYKLEKQSVSITASVSNFNSTPDFIWEQIDSGPSVINLTGENSQTVTFETPTISQDISLKFRVTASNGTQSDSDTVYIYLNDRPTLEISTPASQNYKFASSADLAFEVDNLADSSDGILKAQSRLIERGTGSTIATWSEMVLNGTKTSATTNYGSAASLNIVPGQAYEFRGRVLDDDANVAGISAESIRIFYVNDKPNITTAYSQTISQNTSLSLSTNMLSIIDSDDSSFTLAVESGENYTVSSSTITPDLNFTGTLSVPVTVDDGTEVSNTSYLNIVVVSPSDTSINIQNGAYTNANIAFNARVEVVPSSEVSGVALHIDDNSDVVAQLTGGVFTYDFGTLSIGTHTLYVSVTMSDGNILTTSHLFEVVDEVIPVTTVNAPLNGSEIPSDIEVVAEVATNIESDLAAVSIQLNEGEWIESSSSPFTHNFGILNAGEYVLRAKSNKVNGVESEIEQINFVVLPAQAGEWAEAGGTASDASFTELTASTSNYNGPIAGRASVNGGAASYTIPIPLPPGRNGVQPDISLSYSSRGGLGNAGVGWNLSAGSSITRCPQIAAKDGIATGISFTANDRLCLNGERLVKLQGTYGASGTTYTTETDKLLTVTQSGSLGATSVTFSVALPDGSVETYGSNADSRIIPGSLDHTLTWLIDNHTDVTGNNEIHYIYGEFGTGEKLITEIQYSHDKDASDIRKVVFGYESSGHYRTSYINGGKTRSTQRLNTINTYVGASEVFSFDLEYTQSGASSRPLLSEVIQCGADENGAEQCKEHTSFTWSDNTPHYKAEVLTDSSGNEPYPELTNTDNVEVSTPIEDINIQYDLNGDGVRDWISNNSTGPDTINFVNAEGQVTSSASAEIFGENCKFDYYSHSRRCVVGDFDLNGTSDTLRETDSGQLQIGHWQTDSNSFSWEQTSLNLDPNMAIRVIIGAHDLNADGYPDLLVRHGNSTQREVRVYYNDHVGYENNSVSRFRESNYAVLYHEEAKEGESWSYQNFDEEMKLAGNLNGDSIPDFVITTKDGSGIRRYVLGMYISKIQNGNPEYDSVNLNYPITFDSIMSLADINGDGLLDWVGIEGTFADDDNNDKPLNARINKGDGSFSALLTFSDVFLPRRAYANKNDPGTDGSDPSLGNLNPYFKFGDAVKVADLNGDGVQEILFPDSIVVNACYRIRLSSGGIANKCGGQLRGNYQDNGATLTVSPDMDSNIYQYTALQFEESASGTISAQYLSTPLVGMASQSMIVDTYGKGLPDMVTLSGCRYTDCDMGDAEDVSSEVAAVFTENVRKIIVMKNYGATSSSDPGAEDYVPADMLLSVDNGAGVISEWDYSPLSSGEYTNFYDPQRDNILSEEAELDSNGHFNFASSMYAVASFKQSNGIGDSKNEIQYQYAGAVYNALGRGFRGFKSITQRNLTQGISTYTSFRQIFPYSSLIEQQVTYNTTSANHDWTCMSDLAATASSCMAISVTENEWGEVTGRDRGNSYLLHMLRADSASYDPANNYEQYSASVVSVLSSDVDSFGNVLKKTTTVTDYFEDGGESAYVTVEEAEFDGTISWPSKYSWKSVIKRAVSPADTSLELQTGSNNESVVKTVVSAWNTDVRKPEDIEVYHGEASSGATSSTAATLLTTTHVDYNAYGLPVSQEVTGDVYLGDSTAATSQTRTTTTNYTMNGSIVATDGYLPFTVTQTVNSGLSLNTQTQYNVGFGAPISQTDVGGVETSTTLDPFGRPSTVTVDGVPIQYMSYHAVSSDGPANAVMMVQLKQAGSPTQKEYKDMLGRPLRTAVQSFESSSTYIYQDTVYNELGQKTSESNPYKSNDASAKKLTTYSSYDVLGRVGQKYTPTITIDGGTKGLTTEYTYKGHTTDIVVTPSGSGHVMNMSRTYNSLKQLISTTDAADNDTSYAYDGAGNVILIRDANDNDIVASYDAIGRKAYVIDPNQGRTDFAYNSFGELESETDANGESIYYDMDHLGRVVSRTGDNGARADFEWDTRHTGKLSSQSVTGHSTNYYYDSEGRVTSTVVNIAGTAYTTQTAYDSNYGRPISLTYPSIAGAENGLTIAYEYNARGYLTHEKNAANDFVYRQVTAQDAFGNISGAMINGGGLTGVYTYDKTGGQMLATQAGLDHNIVYSDYDSYGNLLEVENTTDFLSATTNKDIYEYDNLHRLTSSEYHFADGQVTINYGYDAVGNILKKTDYSADNNNAYQYESNSNRLTAVTLVGNGSVTFGYDHKGNQTSRNGTQEVTYNVFNKPVHINRKGAVSDFNYGADLSRYKQISSDNSGSTTTYYIGKHFEVKVKGEETTYDHYISDVAVVTLSSTESAKIGYTHRDRLGSATTITNDRGIAVSRRYFDPFGRPRAGDWSFNTPSTLAGNFAEYRPDLKRGFTDHEHLDQAELIHMNGRVYDYNVGRFMSVDPFIQSPANSQSINPYSYVMNNPLSGTDPTGYCSKTTGSNICTDQMKDQVKSVEVNTETNEVKVTAVDSNGAQYSFSYTAENASESLGQLGSSGQMDIEGQGENAKRPGGGAGSTLDSTIKGGIETLKKGGKFGLGIGMAIVPTNQTEDEDGTPAGELTSEQQVESYIYRAFQIGVEIGENDAANHKENNIAVIGEQQTRVIREARRIGALQIQPSWPEEYNFRSDFMKSFSQSVRDRISLAYNRGWINGVMNSNFKIVDIGRSQDYRGRQISSYYRMELQEIARREYVNYARRPVIDTLSFPSYGR